MAQYVTFVYTFCWAGTLFPKKKKMCLMPSAHPVLKLLAPYLFLLQ